MAIKYLEKAAGMAPKSREIWFELGQIHRLAQDYENAIKAYKRANEISADAITYNMQSFSLLKLKKFRAALQCCVEAINLDSKYATSWNNLGLTWHHLGKYDKALECYQQALILDPDYTLAYNNMGLTQEALKNKESAIEYYEKAIRMDSTCLDARKNLLRFKESTKITSYDWIQDGIAYRELGKYENALSIFISGVKFRRFNKDAQSIFIFT